MKLSSILPCALAIGASAQSTTYTDANTGITFESFTAPSLTFGIVLPTTPGSDFIGTIIGKGTAGYSGISLGGGMVNKLLITAWPNAMTIKSSFRKAAAYASPAVAEGAFTMTPIAKGTFTNATHYSYTFLCKGCILKDDTTFAPNATDAVLGWAYGATGPTTPSSVTTTFNRHSAQGNFGINLVAARSASYATWAMLATPSTEAAVAVPFRA